MKFLILAVFFISACASQQAFRYNTLTQIFAPVKLKKGMHKDEVEQIIKGKHTNHVYIEDEEGGYSIEEYTYTQKSHDLILTYKNDRLIKEVVVERGGNE